jgi:hypothetical protein
MIVDFVFIGFQWFFDLLVPEIGHNLCLPMTSVMNSFIDDISNVIINSAMI